MRAVPFAVPLLLAATVVFAQDSAGLKDLAACRSGVDTVDQARAMYLSELARDFAGAHLRQGGDFLIKLFQGEGFDAYIADLRKGYQKLAIRKPAASRRRSNEVYALATGKR